MTTERMEIYSLEDGDTIIYLGNYYKYLDTNYNVDGTVSVLCVDEEGYRKAISAPDDSHSMWILVLDNDEAVV